MGTGFAFSSRCGCTRFSRNCLWSLEFDCSGCRRAYRCLLLTIVTSNIRKNTFFHYWLIFGWVSTNSIADHIDQLLPWIYYTHVLYDWLLEWLLISSSSDLNISSAMYDGHCKNITLVKPVCRYHVFIFQGDAFSTLKFSSFELYHNRISNSTTTEGRLCFQLKK